MLRQCRQIRPRFAGILLVLCWLRICQLGLAIETFDGFQSESVAPPAADFQPFAEQPDILPPGPIQPSDNAQWEPLRIEPSPDWSAEENPWTIQDEPAPDPTPESSLVWVLGGDRGIGWFGIENLGMLSYWGPEGLHGSLGYSILFLEGPQETDLNPRLFGFQYGVQWRQTIMEPWSYEVVVAPGVYSDFEDSAREGVRIQGHAFGMWTHPGIQFVLGVDYLDRENLKMLPIVGAVYDWNEATRLELVFPKPRIARLVKRDMMVDRWIYLRGDYSGDSWAVERDTGLADVVTLNEVCIVLGTEAWYGSGRHSSFELGWHFNRDLEYLSGLGNFTPQDTISFRLGSRY